jgi:polar amino acid transport system substrate-binding protein
MSRLDTVRKWARRHPRWTVALAAGVAALLTLWALTRPGMPLGPIDLTWHRMQVNRDFYVGIDPSYPPFAEWTPDAIVGIEPDIARKLGERMGVETSILIMGYDGLYDALYTGEVDLILAGLRADPLYAEWVHYSPPYFDAGQVLVSRADAPVGEMAALDGKRLAVEIASAGDQAAQRWQRRLDTLHVERYLLPEDALVAVERGEVDAALVDAITAREYLRTHSGLVRAAEMTAPDEYVIAMRRANYRLIEAVEASLADMQADGTLDAIIEQWLGPEPSTQGERNASS